MTRCVCTGGHAVRPRLSFSRRPLARSGSQGPQRDLVCAVGHGSGPRGGPVRALPPASSAYALCVDNLHMSLGEGETRRHVLRGVDLKVRQGHLHMLLGPNGCGKSTLLRCLGGLLQPDSGTIGTDRPVGFVFQNPDHQVVMPTVGSDVAFGLGRHDLSQADVIQRVSDALEAMNLKGFMDRPTHTLSGGQKQRVAIAGALVEEPALLLLDELTTFLDEEEQENVAEAVASAVRNNERGVTAVWVTHRLEELTYADSATYMDEGRIVVTGAPDDVLAHMKKLGARV